MSNDTGQLPLPEALNLKSLEHGRYVHKIPPSLCFGSVAFGGYTTSYIHKACAHFTAQPPNTANHHDLHHSSIQFFRPVFPDPREIELYVTIASANKAWTVLHAEVKQNGKVCTAGYVTLCDFSVPNTLNKSLGWQLSPPAPSVDLEALSKDADPGWVTYHTPWNPKGLAKPWMYVSHSLPVTHPPAHDRSTTTQWIRAYWPETPDKPALWTDEMIPFVMDMAAPTMPDLIDPSCGAWNELIERGRLQAQARARGQSDNDARCTDDEGVQHTFPWIASTMSMTTEIKRRLPNGGVRCLMLRASSKTLIDNRTDYELILMDERGELIAVGSQVMVIMPVGVKQDKKRVADPKL